MPQPPFGFISRPGSRESAALMDFATRHLSCRPISPQDYAGGRWIRQLPELLALPRTRSRKENGADEAARFIAEKLGLSGTGADQ